MNTDPKTGVLSKVSVRPQPSGRGSCQVNKRGKNDRFKTMGRI